MPVVKKNCICPIPLGGQECETITGISELYYASYKQIISIVYAVTASGCCNEGEIESFGMDTSLTPLPEELFQQLDFIKQDDDSGALIEYEWSDDGGNKVRNYTVTVQANIDTPDQQCTVDGIVGKEIAFLYKGKNGVWGLVNWNGGAKVSNVTGNTNQSYAVLVLSGRSNSRHLFVSYTDGGVWAAANLVPVTLNPAGLLNPTPVV